MRRRLLAVLTSIVLGSLTTLAIAWACAAWVNPNRAPMTFSTSQASNGDLQATSIQKCFGHTRVNRSTLTDLQRDPATGAIQSIGVRGDSYGESESRTGWPMRAMRCGNTHEVTLGDGQAILQAHFSGTPGRTGLIGLSPWRGPGPTTWRALPDRPMWPGFTIDTLVYAAAWWVIIFGWQRHRRARRIERGLCSACGYDLRGSDSQACSECGKAVKV